jgi:hypothetical protein
MNDKPQPSGLASPLNAAEPGNPPPTVSDVEKHKWARAAVIISVLAAGFVFLQWYEMHTTSVNTHALAEAAKTQATG